MTKPLLHKKPRGGWTCRNRPTIYETIWDRYIETVDGCWEWTSWRSPKGYGYGFSKGKRLAATHVALVLSGRPRPSLKHHALHSCDNPPCINPAHLRWGTNRENVDDKIERGRHQPVQCPNGHDYTPENTRIYSGVRRCVICFKEADRRYKAKRREIKEKMSAR